MVNVTLYKCGCRSNRCIKITHLNEYFENLLSHFIENLIYFCSSEIFSPEYLFKISWSLVLDILLLHRLLSQNTSHLGREIIIHKLRAIYLSKLFNIYFFFFCKRRIIIVSRFLGLLEGLNEVLDIA